MLTYKSKPGQSIDAAIDAAIHLASQTTRVWLVLNGTKVCVWANYTHRDVLRTWTDVRNREAALANLMGK